MTCGNVVVVIMSQAYAEAARAYSNYVRSLRPCLLNNVVTINRNGVLGGFERCSVFTRDSVKKIMTENKVACQASSR